MSTVDVRLARLDDAEAIRRIYNVEVETSTVTFDLVPRTVDEQRRWIEARSGAHAVVVAERERRLERPRRVGVVGLDLQVADAR